VRSVDWMHYRRNGRLPVWYDRPISGPPFFFAAAIFTLSTAARIWQQGPILRSYDVSVVKIYNGTSSLVRFENKYIIFYNEETL
jgi:hypothetical protein